MRQCLLLFLYLNAISLYGQNSEGIGEAIQLNKAGNTLLQKDPLLVFDQLKALEKFQQSGRAFLKAGDTASEVYQSNEEKRRTLIDIFSQSQNSDSLLQITRFYPDSVFQRNTNYTDNFKSMVIDYIALKRSSQRNAFFKLKDLNYRGKDISENTSSLNITFEHYWPLEVIELEGWLNKLEKRTAALPTEAKTEIRKLQLQNKLATLRNQENTTYLDQTKQTFQRRITKAEETISNAESAYNRLKTIGLGLMGLLLIIGYWIRKKSVQFVNSKNQLLWEEKKRADDLLSNMLPAEVVRELKTKGTAKAQKKEAISVFFSDFKSFSQIAENLSPEELVKELDHCFTVFDRIIEKHRLQKIKIIGDAYLCVGGLYTRGGNHLHRMIYAALEIQQFLNDRKAIQGKKGELFFEARIGIHIGPIVAGVIGKKAIAFDVWGDTVNVAQQMEHHSEAGKVNISGEIYELIKNRFICTPRGKITAKNKQVYDMYFVEEVIK